jgi:predicted permease
MFARLRSLVRALTSRGDFETGLTDELRFHIEQYTEDLVRSGVSPKEARRRARMELGGINTVKEECRDAHGLGGFDALDRECRYAARQLWRNPGFAATVVLTLGLAIGANTAIFSLVNALLLKGSPYAHPERIGTLYLRTSGPQSSDRRRTVDGEQWERVRDDVPSLLSAVSATTASGTNVRAGAVAQFLQVGRVSAHYFDVLALHPAIGRNFSEDEDRPQGPRTTILSYALWKTAFGGNASVLGQAVLLKGEPHTIIGVLPESATTPLNGDLYTALQPGREGEGRAANFIAVMRLRESATWQQADAELNRALSETTRTRDFASANSGAQPTYYAVPLQKAATDTLRPQVLGLVLAAGFILLIACANIAGLTLVRMLRRTGEITIRLALGASRWQIHRQLWIEHLLLACVGGTAGIGVAFLGLRGLLLLLPEHFLPVTNVPLDGRVLGFTLSLALLTSVLSGVLPVLATRKVDLRSSVGGRGVVGGSSVRPRQLLIAGEVALTVVLLAATGLLIRTLIGLQTIPPGFNPTGVITAKASLDDVRYHDPAAFRELLTESLTAMREIPGVQSAAVGLTLPYERALLDAVTLSDGKEAGQKITTNRVYVTPRYFETLQIPVLAGRTFTDADRPDAQPVVIVNQTFARKFFRQEDPVGRYLNKDVLIVGVVADTVLSSAAGLNAGTAPLTREETVYVPAAQVVDAKLLSLVHVWFQPSWIVRTASPTGVPAQMRRALATADPQLPVSGFYEMKDLVAAALAKERIAVALLSAMSSLALLLSAVGIFALVANTVAQRTREIGIRMALGSTIGKTMIQVGRTGVGASALGLALGLILCAAALPPMRSVLYGVGVYDAPTMLAVVLTLCAVTLLATTPILRVARIDPARTLREE